MTSNLGIMQGRLSPDFHSNFQFFPENWQAEFPLAKDIGFRCIEWLVDWRKMPVNPLLLSLQKIDEIKQLSIMNMISVESICADYFMQNRLFGADPDVINNSLAVLSTIVSVAVGQIGVKVIVLPFLEELALVNYRKKREVVSNLMDIMSFGEYAGLSFALETEMNCDDLKRFIDLFDRDNIGVCYDLGNCTSYGHNCPRDIKKLGSLIKVVHVKDRKLGSAQSVYLGEGDVDFEGCFDALAEINFSGPLILQAWRGEDYLNDARSQLSFVKEGAEKTGLLKGEADE